MQEKEILQHTKHAIEELTPDCFDAIWEASNNRSLDSQILPMPNPAVVRRKSRRHIATALAVLAASLFCIVGAGWYHQFAAIYTTVNVDVNPSICLYLNRQEKILSIEGINEDGKSIVGQLDNVSHERIADVLPELVDQMAEGGYLSTSEENAILISVDMKNTTKAEAMVEELSEQMYQVMDQKQLCGNIVSQTMECHNKDIQDLSKQLQVSHGKATFIKELSDKNSHISQKELADMKMTEILEVTEEQNVDITTLSRSPRVKKIPFEPSDKEPTKETQAPIPPDKSKTTGASNQSSSSDKPKTTGASNQSSSADKANLINTKQEEEQRPQPDNKTNPDTKRESAPNNASQQKDSDPHSSSNKNKPDTHKQKPSADEKQLPQSTQQPKTPTPPEAAKETIERQQQPDRRGDRFSPPREEDHANQQPDVHQKEQTPAVSSVSTEAPPAKEPAHTVAPSMEAEAITETPEPTITPVPSRKPKPFPNPHFPFGTISLLERWF